MYPDPLPQQHDAITWGVYPRRSWKPLENADFKIMEDDRKPPLTPKSQISTVFLQFFGVLDPQNLSKLPRTSFFYPGKARQCRCSRIQVRFRPFSGFRDFRFLCPGIPALGFRTFRGPGSVLKSNYEQNQPSGGSKISKTTPLLDFKSKEGRDFQNKLQIILRLF